MRTSTDFLSEQCNLLSEKTRECVRGAIEYDDRRESAPHEHTATLAGGVVLLLSALMVPGRTAAVLQAAAGGALLLRAAAGRDGLRKWSGAASARPAQATHAATDPAGGPAPTGAPGTNWPNVSEAGI